MGSTVGRQVCANQILPLITELLKDDNHEVRLSTTQNMISLAKVMGEQEFMSANMKTVCSQLTKDQQWRVRMAVFEFLGDFTLSFEGPQAFENFKTLIEPIFMAYMTNSAASVRMMGVQKSKELVRASFMPHDWVADDFVTKCTDSYNVDQQGYNYRMCAIESLAAIMGVLSKEEVTSKIVPTLVKALNDRIPNVQFCACRII